jgi:dienelactone hydrolase
VSHDLALTIHGLSQAVWDVRRLLSWIRSESDAPIVLYGVSLGGYTAALVAALTDVDGLVAGVPAVDLPELFRVHAPRAMRRRIEQIGLLDAAREAFRVVSPLELVPRVPRERRAIYAGMGDRFVPAHQTVALWRHWDEPELRWYPGGHVGFVWSKPAAAFVEGRLAGSLHPA